MGCSPHVFLNELVTYQNALEVARETEAGRESGIECESETEPGAWRWPDRSEMCLRATLRSHCGLRWEAIPEACSLNEFGFAL